MDKTILLSFALLSISTACPIWTVQTSSQCICGDSLKGVVDCSLYPYQVSVLGCYCMTYNDKISKVTVGRCLITCQGWHLMHEIQSKEPHQLNDEVCGHLNRTGQLCGDCVPGHAPPVHSYSLKCVHCDERDFAYNLAKYVFFAFFPLTILYIIVILWKVSITSHKMVAFVFTCQIMTSPYLLQMLTETITKNFFFVLCAEYLSIWNLDVLRIMHAPFCLHPRLNTMHVIALDYVVAVYPLLLIAATYAAVALHDRYTLVVAAWKPVQRVLACIRKEWNIRGSLVGAFATFLVLSYVKILNVSLELLISVHLHESRYGQELYYLFSAGTIPYFQREHLPYGILALLMLFTFNFLPVLFLMLYPVRCFRKLLCINNNLVLFTFMDAFQGCYRTKPRDLRSFAALYLFVRILQLLTFAAIPKETSILPITGFYLIILSIVVILVEPYNSRLQNKLDGVILLNAACIFLLIPGHDYYHTFDRRIYTTTFKFFYKSALIICVVIQFLYGLATLMTTVCPPNIFKRIQKRLARKANSEGAPLIT